MNVSVQLFVVSLAFLINCWALEDKCPSASSMKPCTCKTYLDGTCIVTCSLASQKDLDRIADLTSGLCDGHVHFVLVHSSVEGIPVKLWKNLLQSKTVDVTIKHAAVKYLVSSGSSSETIGDVSTEGEAIFKVTHSKVEQWNWNQFSDFFSEGELTVIVDDSPMSMLGSDFKNIAKGRVHKVTIDGTGLSQVQDQEFTAFDDLSSLSLQNNELTTVSRSMISRPALKLQFLHLNGNKLTSLPKDLFSDMPALEVVYLRENNLKTLPNELFQDISSTKLQRIDFVYNPWVCDCNLLSVLKSTKTFLNMGTCAAPEALQQKKVKDLHSFIECP